MDPSSAAVNPDASLERVDALVIGSGFGGSVAALRLAEKGYRVVVLEQGRRFEDDDFPKTNWDLPNYLWMPSIGMHGFMGLALLKEALVFHGCGVGGGSLVYANVLMEPDDEVFREPEWTRLEDWRSLLTPHYVTAKRMLGVTETPSLAPADLVLREVATSFGQADSFRPTRVGVFFGTPEVEVEDPYFKGEGPRREGCRMCGGCMVGCRYNAKNMLTKNYLYLAERHGVEIRAGCRATNIRPVRDDGYLVDYRVGGRGRRIHAASVVIAGGTLGTLGLLFRCRDETGGLPALSNTLGSGVRTNSEALLGSGAGGGDIDYSEGIAISADARIDSVTHVQPVRYPKGSSFIRLLALPLIESSGSHLVGRLAKVAAEIVRHPRRTVAAMLGRRWAERTTILLVMQRVENRMSLRWRRSWLRAGRGGLEARRDPLAPIPGEIPQAHRAIRSFAARTGGTPMGNAAETLLGRSATAHLIGGCPMGRTVDGGVVDTKCRVHGYPGLYVVDSTVLPANPGINPSLTIAALAEYAMAHIPARGETPPAA
jgi:cholesterol oxidase